MQQCAQANSTVLVPLSPAFAPQQYIEELRSVAQQSQYEKRELYQLADLIEQAPARAISLPSQIALSMRQCLLADLNQSRVGAALAACFDQARPAPAKNPRVHDTLRAALQEALSFPGQTGLAARDELLEQLRGFVAMHRTATNLLDIEQQRLQQGGPDAEATYPQLMHTLQEAVHKTLSRRGLSGLVARDALLVNVRLFRAMHETTGSAREVRQVALELRPADEHQTVHDALCQALEEALARRPSIGFAARDALFSRIEQFLQDYACAINPTDTEQQAAQRVSTEASVEHPAVHRLLTMALDTRLAQDGAQAIKARDNLLQELRAFQPHKFAHLHASRRWIWGELHDRVTATLLVYLQPPLGVLDRAEAHEAIFTQVRNFVRSHTASINPQDAEQVRLQSIMAAANGDGIDGPARALLVDAVHRHLREGLRTALALGGERARRELLDCVREWAEGRREIMANWRKNGPGSGLPDYLHETGHKLSECLRQAKDLPSHRKSRKALFAEIRAFLHEQDVADDQRDDPPPTTRS
ncbi:hypothetical protein P8605_06180 [Streptomyces sp. T-3]|nr:hypothetical protein [Streptomyces sp. T-3]